MIHPQILSTVFGCCLATLVVSVQQPSNTYLQKVRTLHTAADVAKRGGLQMIRTVDPQRHAALLKAMAVLAGGPGPHNGPSVNHVREDPANRSYRHRLVDGFHSHPVITRSSVIDRSHGSTKADM